ncbi:hypothetical protein [Microcoleus sp. bin48.metabat.b7b8b9.023]|nr:hypothetical protein [Microcoleus sp. bin48.metabat.b7b8b9.023]
MREISYYAVGHRPSQGIGHRPSQGIGHRPSQGIEHRASGIGHRASGIGHESANCQLSTDVNLRAKYRCDLLPPKQV